MQFIYNFIDWIVSLCTTLYDFFLSIIDSLSMLFHYLGLVGNLAYDLIASLPSWLQAFGTITIFISVLYMVIGRQTGGGD